MLRNTAIKPIIGSALLELYKREYWKKLVPDKISSNEKIAVERIFSFFGLKPSIDGTNITGIVEIRDEFYKLSSDPRYSNSVIISAPHTHWESDKPIVYSFDSNECNYILGHHSIVLEEYYYPVSFVFAENGILPYEWADSSNKIIEKEWETTFSLIQQLNLKVAPRNYPLGIEIDFKFKASLLDQFVEAEEQTIIDENSPFYHFSCVKAIENVEVPLSEVNGGTQVIWHGQSDKMLNFSSMELKLLNEIRSHLNEIEDSDQRETYFSEIEKKISSSS